MKYFKTMNIIFALIFTLVAASLVSAAVSTDFNINRVDVDGVTAVVGGNALYVERGTTVPVTLYITGLPAGTAVPDARAHAYIGGYEYGKVEAESSIFEIVPNVEYTKTLKIKIPVDMSATQKYTLNVEVYDGSNYVKYEYNLYVKESRHLLSIYDVILNPVTNVQAGQPLFITSRIENMGDSVESSIKVTASIPTLGVETSQFLDELIRERDNTLNQPNSFAYTRTDAETTGELMLIIPSDAKEGDYELHVKLNYNRGYGSSTDSNDELVRTIHVKGAKVVSPPPSNGVSTLVTVDGDNKKVNVGEGAVYKLVIANLGADAQTYTVEVLGAQAWGTSRVDPQQLIVAVDKTGEANVYVSPAENTQAGVKSFTVRVKDSAGNVVTDKALSLEVTSNAASGNYDAFKKVLEIGFVGLLIILVILGIVLVAKKLGGDKEPVEGQTYYQ